MQPMMAQEFMRHIAERDVRRNQMELSGLQGGNPVGKQQLGFPVGYQVEAEERVGDKAAGTPLLFDGSASLEELQVDPADQFPFARLGDEFR